jgi:hypothetical protein
LESREFQGEQLINNLTAKGAKKTQGVRVFLCALCVSIESLAVKFFSLLAPFFSVSPW